MEQGAEMTDAEAREMARELVRGSIVEDAVSQFIAQIIKHTHDERVKPLRRQVANLEAKLAKALEALLWCSGSADFNEGGVAREGWLKVCAPLLKGESHDPL